jgi:hypothetical protein|tara:strand:- start:1698 stop:2066 length:369 start_codon:yes stop_codon:yes gene_type:complete
MFENVNDNKYFIGFMMILVNIGSRFIIGELSESQKNLINDKLLRRLFIFGVFFMATRDIISSLVLTIMFVLLVSELFNEDSELSLFPKEEENNDDKKGDSKADNDKKIQDVVDILYDVKNNL